MTDWDRTIIADMQAYIRTIEACLASEPNVGTLYRPMIGDASAKDRAFWENEITKNLGWIADIEKGA